MYTRMYVCVDVSFELSIHTDRIAVLPATSWDLGRNGCLQTWYTGIPADLAIFRWTIPVSDNYDYSMGFVLGYRIFRQPQISDK